MLSLRNVYYLLCSLFLLILARPAISQHKMDCTDNESWISAGTNFGGRIMASTEMNGNLYVLHQMDGVDATSFQISMWDGSVWKAETVFHFAGVSLEPAPIIVTAFQAYNGSIYMGGYFTINDNESLTGFVRWDGSSFSPVDDMPGAPLFLAANSLCIHNGNLIAAAYIYDGPVLSSKTLQFDGSTWTYLKMQGEDISQVSTILSWNGNLYLGRDYNGISIDRWDGTNWTKTVPELNSGFLEDLFIYNNELYAAGSFSKTNETPHHIMRWDGTAWIADIPQPNRALLNGKVTMYGNQAYLISTSDQGFIVGDFGSFETIERFDGTTWHPVSNFDGRVSFLANYKGNLLAGGNFTSSCDIPLGYMGLLCNSENCGGRISGNVFHDANGNCTQDPGDKGLRRRMVAISPGPHYAVTDKDGNYSRFIPDGNYSVSLNQQGHWNRICPADPGTHNVTITRVSGASDINFGVRPIPGIQDLRVSLASGRARQGRQLVYVITYENAGTVPMNGMVRFSHDPMLTFDSADVTPSRYTPNVAEWDFTDLQIDEIRTITVYTTVLISAPVNSHICSQIGMYPQITNAGDDDRDSICTSVTGSYDPNDISVTPFGIENNGVISPEESRLTYMVRFQNTGNDTAFKVVVTDKLSTNLDISSIKLGAASHPFSFSINKDNLLTWTFDNILLPDSSANQTNSNGFFKFSVNMKSGLAPGSQIANFADIYFDYNAPVRTNTVISIIRASSGVDTPADALSSLAMYPNPVRSMLHLDGRLRSGAVVKVRNLLGQEVARYTHNGTGLMTIDASALPAGTYLLEAEMTDGTVVQRVTVMK